MLNSLRALFQREIAALREDLLAYPSDEALWRTAPGIANSAGTLALHLAGNLRHYLGARLGETGYRRDRGAEFTRRDVSREELLRELDEAARVVEDTLAALPPDRLADPFPDPVRDEQVTVEHALLHVLVHLGYHRGQVNYHRRMLEE